MGRFSNILLTADFDRTLTAPDTTIPERNLRAIREFMQEGGAFTVNTGRSLPMIRRFLAQIPTNAPLLLYNGSAAWENGALTLCRPIPLELWQCIDAVHKAFPMLNLELQGVDAHYCFTPNDRWDAFYDTVGCAHAHARRGAELGPFLKFSLFGEIRAYSVDALFHGTEEEVALFDRAESWLNETFRGKVAVFRAAARILDVHAAGVSKSQAARELQARLNRKVLVCIGDAQNDLPMLQGADYAFCPADGALADRFPNVCACADGSVADVIYEKIPHIAALYP